MLGTGMLIGGFLPMAFVGRARSPNDPRAKGTTADGDDAHGAQDEER